jgi:hypothetical protein
MSRSVVVRMLPDNSGRVRIHWFMRDSNGPIPMSQVGQQINVAQGMVETAGGARGWIMCDKKRCDFAPTTIKGLPAPVIHTDDPRSANCPECMNTPEWREAMKAYADLAPTVEG